MTNDGKLSFFVAGLCAVAMQNAHLMLLMLTTRSSPRADYITVLAIYDEPPSKNKSNGSVVQQTTSKLSIPIIGCSSKFSGESVKSTSNDNVVQNSTVSGTTLSYKEAISLSSDNNSPSILRNSGKKNQYRSDGTHSVHFEGNGQPSANVCTEMFHNAEKWNGNSRKSRISNSFLDAKELIEKEMNGKWSDFDRNLYQFQRIVLSSDTQELPLGLEVSPVPNQSIPGKLLAVEVRSIEEKGRIAEDGRLRVGDQLVEINEASCDMISFARVQLRLRELQSIPNPSFSFFRRLSKYAQKIPQRLFPVTTALQIGNTAQIGETRIVHLKKGEDGFGFTYAGRESFANDRKENLFYVKALRKELPEIAIGDRILQIDQMSLAEMTQSEVTTLLKSKSVGEIIELLISRSVVDDQKQQHIDGNQEKKDSAAVHLGHSSDQMFASLNAHLSQHPDLELHCLDIQLNDTPGAGLGLSLKAQRVGTTDSGLFIRSILHGSAAFKDGRLQINDRLVGIEDQNLLNYELNGEALESFMRTISQLPQTKRSIRLFVLRHVHQSRDSKPFGGGVRRGSDSDVSQLSSFDREAPSRRSISEKHSLVTRRDPSQLRAYQQIVHQRQISAPSLSTRTVANSNRSRRSLYDELRRVRSSHAGPSTKKQRPKTLFYVDESGTAVTSQSDFSSTFPPNSVHTIDNNTNCSNSQPWHSEKNKALSSSTSHPLTLSDFAKSATTKNNKNAYGQQCQDESELLKQPKNRRGSLSNGLFKLFSRGSTHKEKDDAGRESDGTARTPHHRPPPPPYRLPSAVHQQHCHSCHCASMDQCCPQQCSRNPDPMTHFGHHNRTNNCTKLQNFCRSSFQPTPAGSLVTSLTTDHLRPFLSPPFGLAEVHHSRNDDPSTTSILCQQRHQLQHWPAPQYTQSFIRPSQRADLPTPPSQSAWTTMTRSIPGSLPGRVLHDFSGASEGIRAKRHQSLHRSRTKHKTAKPSAVFYDQCSDWVIRC